MLHADTNSRKLKITSIILYLRNELMNWAGFLDADTNSLKLEITLTILEWAWPFRSWDSYSVVP